ncbi:MAG: DUF4199 family protein [Gemmatimonadales bacterium]|nr:DUF4199 family protein [Gemmatimonadales bacterium]
MLKSRVKWGIGLGVAMFGWTMGVHFLGFYTSRIEYASLVDRLALLLPFLAVFGALWQLRRDANGRFPIRAALLSGLVVGAVAAPFTIASLWFYHEFINPEWLELLISFERDRLTALGTPPDEILRQTAQMQQRSAGGNPVVNGFIGSVLICGVMALAQAPVFALGSRRTRDTLHA